MHVKFQIESPCTLMHGGVFQIKVPCTLCMVEFQINSHMQVFQIKVPVHNAWWSLSNESPCTQCMVESFKLKSLYTMHGGVFQIKFPVHYAWWSLSN